MSDVSAIVLAAGRGKRMNSHLPKVLHLVGGRPMVAFSLLAAQSLSIKKTVLVVPEEYRLIEDAISAFGKKNKTISYAVQATPLGTGDAVRCALEQGKIGATGTVIVLNGDMPLISTDTIREILTTHHKNKASLTLLSTHKKQSFGFGRIKRNAKGEVLGIVEEKDCTAEEKKITELNVGVYAFDLKFLKKTIYQIKDSNKQKEYYLTDLLALAIKDKRVVKVVTLSDDGESMGANSPAELAMVNTEFYRRKREELIQSGVVLLGSEIFVDADSQVHAGSMLQSPCYISGESVIESQVTIETGCVIKSSSIKAGSHLKAYCYLDNVKIENDCHVGPFAHLRPDSFLLAGAKVGNFVETKKSTIGEGSKVNHLSYIGDATVGKGVNIGAGTITCNYDGEHKYQTVIEDGVFIGSDTQLVAPVRLGQGCFVGAGTTVTKDVAPSSLVISRVPQREIPNWAAKRGPKKKSA